MKLTTLCFIIIHLVCLNPLSANVKQKSKKVVQIKFNRQPAQQSQNINKPAKKIPAEKTAVQLKKVVPVEFSVGEDEVSIEPIDANVKKNVTIQQKQAQNKNSNHKKNLKLSQVHNQKMKQKQNANKLFLSKNSRPEYIGRAVDTAIGDLKKESDLEMIDYE